MNKQQSTIKLLHNIRKEYAAEEKFYYLNFCAFVLLLLLDFIIIIYTRMATLNAYAWSGIILLFIGSAVSGMQSVKYRTKKENLDTFYLSGEYK